MSESDSVIWSIPDPCPLGTQSLREALLHHYYEAPLCRRMIQLLQVVADAVRAMHEEGCLHGDLTNECIEVQKSEQGEWSQAWITGKTVKHAVSLSPAQRGRDNARIRLPSDLMRVFLEMQWAPEVPPSEFLEARKRAFKRKGFPKIDAGDTRRRYPDEKDIWIWDDRSMQAIPALRSKDKRKHYRIRDLGCMAKSAVLHGRSIRKEFKKLQSEAWSKPVDMSGRIGLSCNLEPDRFEKERRWLEPLGPLPLLVRLYHHETESNQRYAMEAVRKLQAEGHSVTVALVQDRNAVLYPKKWHAFVDRAGGSLSGFVEGFEIGHAINRVKWGIWNYTEYAQLLKPFEQWSQRYPQVPLMGPAGIDFEFPRILPLLDHVPDGVTWSSFSHHMYVDRRGAPENRQNGYDTVDKLAMAKAAARVHPNCEDRVVVSEVNWPLAGTGVWSPVGSPYQSPGERHHDPSVDEETYADYMRRYILLALCSGMADRVYWWNLAAHGFGLIDDRDPGGWRPRPAYHAFKDLVDQMRGATFLERQASHRKMLLDFEGKAGSYSLQWTLP